MNAIRRDLNPRSVCRPPADHAGGALHRFGREAVVLMDNLRAHKRPEIIQAILVADAVPIYLPPYSPDMNPIEFWWADIKRQLRKFAIDTEPELIEAIRRLRARLSDAKVAGWYRHVQAQLR